ncbi:hypothetical protein [Streptomyces ipomoeae]|nr:hypothetical protein [Streptomyces ipomoeae]
MPRSVMACRRTGSSSSQSSRAEPFVEDALQLGDGQARLAFGFPAAAGDVGSGAAGHVPAEQGLGLQPPGLTTMSPALPPSSVTVVIDRNDDVTHTHAALATHHLLSGRIILHPGPATTSETPASP